MSDGCKIGKLAASTILRAKTSSCKQQLANVACSIYNNTLFPKRLPRYCPTKGERTKDEYLGCYERQRYFNLVVPLSKINRNPETCVNICFTRGAIYAALQYNKLQCFCGNKLQKTNPLSEGSCETDCSNNQTFSCTRALQDNMKVFSTGLPEFKSATTSLVFTDDDVRGMKPVRIVFVFTVSGRAVRQIIRLLKAIYHVDHYYYIHVDSRADYLYRELLKLEAIFPNILLARERLATIWAGASSLQAHFFIMNTLLATPNWTWDYYIILSETHYPLKSVTSLTKYLQKYQGNNFIELTRTADPTANKDKIFVECDEHMWLVGRQQLPEGISFHVGQDWICLHRDFVEYVATGTDPLLTGLKEMYRYTMSPAESFFHILIHNSQFCTRWIDEDMHVINWDLNRGCSCQKHIDAIDWCGCSPMVIKQRDFAEMSENIANVPKFWSRKFEPIIDQEVLNSIDKLLGMHYGGHYSIHRFWQNELHVLDRPSSTTDLTTTFARSFIRRHAMETKESCRLSGFELIETHVLYVGNKFDSYLVKFSASTTGSKVSHILESRFSQIKRFIVSRQDGMTDRLEKLEVGTLYDTKEEIFRNYPGFIGPDSTGITIKYVLNEGIDGNLAISCMDPSGAKVFAVVKHVGSNSTSGGYTLKLNSTNGLQTGIWKVLIHSDRQEIAEMEFLVLPLEVIEGHGGVKQSSQSLLAQIDKLTAQFWEAEGLCSLEDLGPDCPLINTCSKTNWSSMSPDPKSDLIFDGKGSIIK